MSGFGENPGNLRAYEYIPAGLPPNAPLVVVMHGCLQGADDAEDWGWNELADAFGFAVLYPEQSVFNNGARCFNWFGEFGNTDNLERGRGENMSIVSMVRDSLRTHELDPTRVYAVGFSAGGAMVPLLLATWPDVFAAGAVNAGVPYRCANDTSGGLRCQTYARDLSPEYWARVVREAAPEYRGAMPRISIWHGEDDSIVNPANLAELRDQWTGAHGIDQSADVIHTFDNGAAYRGYEDDDGNLLVETVMVPSLSHRVGRGESPYGSCGRWDGYTDVTGLCTSLEQARFFGLDGVVDPVDSEPAPEDSDPAATECEDVFATNYAHLLAGRAELAWVVWRWTYRSLGGGESLTGGLYGASSLFSVDGGTSWYVGGCPDE